MKLNLREMFEAGVHFGHRTRFWNPKMESYIFGSKNNIYIINLDKTLTLMGEALEYIDQVVSNKGHILFVGTKKSASQTIKEYAKQCGMPYVNYRWLGGMLTNFKTIKQSIRRLKEIENMEINGTLAKLTKKEKLEIESEKRKKENVLGGIKDMRQMPQAIFIIDIRHEEIAIKEAKKIGIPVIAVVDTNNNPSLVDFIIPGNDDSRKSINYYLSNVANVINNAISKISNNNDNEPEIEITSKSG